MDGKTVTARSPIDSVRIEYIGEGRAVQIPAELIRAADDVLRAMVFEKEDLTLVVSEAGTPLEHWDAEFGDFRARGGTPWQAIKNLSDRLQWDGRDIKGRCPF